MIYYAKREISSHESAEYHFLFSNLDIIFIYSELSNSFINWIDRKILSSWAKKENMKKLPIKEFKYKEKFIRYLFENFKR
jgi:hypothetical protein